MYDHARFHARFCDYFFMRCAGLMYCYVRSVRNIYNTHYRNDQTKDIDIVSPYMHTCICKRSENPYIPYTVYICPVGRS